MNQTTPPEIVTTGKRRHGCLTAWLIFMMIMNPAAMLLYLVGDYSYLPGWFIPAMLLASLVNLGAAIALFKWKKFGFWLFCGSATIVFFLNLLVGLGFFSSLMGLVGVALLFGVLNIGKENKGWTQLE